MKVGNGKKEIMKLHRSIELKNSWNDVVNEVYEGIEQVQGESCVEYFGSRCLLAPHNKDVDEINKRLLSVGDGNIICYRSRDILLRNGARTSVTELNSLCFPYMPPHELCLKKNIPVIVIKNCGTLVNGTRGVIMNLSESVLQVKILNGRRKGETELISRKWIKTDSTETIQMCRLQFPIKVAFGITINRAQGQTFDKCGVLLEPDVFCHGQLYVALSRIRDPRNLFVYCGNCSVKNVVYHEVI
jgi:ATP-dependent DNA helicase PIF1